MNPPFSIRHFSKIPDRPKPDKGRRGGWEIVQTPSGIFKAQVIGQTASGLSIAGKLPTVSAKSAARLMAAFPLSWSHYVRLLSVEKPQARAFYESEAIRGGWSVRQLDRQISTQFFERTAHSKWYRIDLLLFHRRLKCLVVIDLKIGKFTHADAGQMNLYLNYARENLMEAGENEPVGLILCSAKNDAVAHYAMGGIQAKVFASHYLTNLPDEESLRREILSTQRAIQTRQDAARRGNFFAPRSYY